ncbi:MAG: histidinol-phosphatase [Actinobacteria bacterium]|nr:histidinol-phosphatase [Actinomycetota bacterium]
MSSTPTELRDVAVELAALADGIASGLFGGRVPATVKPDGSPVTAADREIEATLRQRIGEVLPAATVFGEEDGGELATAGVCFVIDPIDGTKNFMRGVPVFATLIGVLVDGAVVAGVASAPAMGERWDAATDAGTRCNGEPVGVSAIDQVDDAHVLHGGLNRFSTDPHRWQRLARIANEAWRTRGFGEFWMHLLVAGGQADVAFEDDLSIWDIAALEIIVTEAGGRMTTWDGTSIVDGDGTALTTNGLLHDAFRSRLAR